MKSLIVCLAIASCASAALLPTYNRGQYNSAQNFGQYNSQYSGQYRHVVPTHAPVQYHHPGPEANAHVLRSASDVQPSGHYSYEYETSNGISAKESGLAAKSVQGGFSYTAPDGTPIQLNYVADENGFHPVGAHLPVAPETPAHVLRLLEYIASHPQQDEHVARNFQQVQHVPVVQKPVYSPFRYNKF